jgi:hypothetical protein
MATNVQLLGEVLADSRQAFADGEDKNVQLNKQGAVLVALPLPINAEVARQQVTFVAGTATAVAPVAAIPTTASHLSLYNPATSTKSLIVHRVTSYCVASAAAVIQASILLHMTTVAVTSLTGTAATSIKSISGAGNASVAQIYSAVTTVANGVWHPIGVSNNFGAQTATIAMALDSGDLGGLYIVEPGMHLDMAILCSAAGSATFSSFFTWSEIVV